MAMSVTSSGTLIRISTAKERQNIHNGTKSVGYYQVSGTKRSWDSATCVTDICWKDSGPMYDSHHREYVSGLVGWLSRPGMFVPSSAQVSFIMGRPNECFRRVDMKEFQPKWNGNMR